ncbi:class I SAM-dependent methyltransferase [Novosphingobium umbonatum]|uniref:Class I SAM-dependent methyltransferase n=1 Tax=Novosphingobium umbonatum TaxID=1908524 RepID=A0A3S2VSC7_9SPHN|nr:class I SAM-dependent methyltransferase [Novosphingobium umbonatum]RVU04468.1 class I SAM-dependent methyltransferase [Novosphingobium umbonatum]
MSEAFLHSVAEYASLIVDCLAMARAREVVEVTQAPGGIARQIVPYLEQYDGRLTVIDPAPDAEFLHWQMLQPQVISVAAHSLDAVGLQNDVDAWILDGDHNYHTVSNELRMVSSLADRDGRPVLAFVHDVGWPWGRRDFYGQPDRIPSHARHAAGRHLPAVPDELCLWGGDQAAYAVQEGGPRNGVLSAVEDFLRDSREMDLSLAYAHVPAIFGLGVIYDKAAPYAAALAQRLAPWDRNPLLARMEDNRLRQIGADPRWSDVA